MRQLLLSRSSNCQGGGCGERSSAAWGHGDVSQVEKHPGLTVGKVREGSPEVTPKEMNTLKCWVCLLYTSDAADEERLV